jgi:hypothetical protein
MKVPPEVLELFRREGAKGGKIGGRIRMAKLSRKERSQLAKKAATASAKVRSARAKAKKRAAAKRTAEK